MNKLEILNKCQKVIDELKPYYEILMKDNKMNINENNIYIAISFVSKLYGINSIFNDEFIKDNNLDQLVKKIDVDMVKLQATHYQDKNLFYDFINILYPQLQYRLSQIKYKYSLSEEEQKKLIITAEYQVYLYNLLKYYLEEKTTPEIQEKIKEILSIVNLYKVVNDPNIVALGSEITYMDSLNNEVFKGKIVINSHANLNHKKLPLSQMKKLFTSHVNDIVCIDFSLSYYIRILDIKNIEEKPTL